MGESHKPRKERKQREMNPIKLVMDRGLHVIPKEQTDKDGNKVTVMVPSPKGVVLAPYQAQVLAGFISEQARTIKQLDAIVQQMLKDEEQDADEEDEGADSTPESQEDENA